MTWILTILALILGPAAMLGAAFFFKRKAGTPDTGQEEKFRGEIAALDSRISTLLQTTEGISSKAQYDSVVTQTAELVSTLEKQKSLLKEVEDRLDKAQKDVESKEVQQQEVKSAKEEDAAKLEELLANHESISAESMQLEHRLGQSLKELDILVTEVTLDENQKAVLQEFSAALMAGGSRLRDLITDYKAVYERLEGIKLQHADLEDEYTKLVEQQLGG